MHIVFEHSRPLPVPKYGGTERIIFWHMKELRRLGHRVTLIGHPRSRVENLGIELIAQPKRYAPGQDWRSLIPRDADLLHLFYTPHQALHQPLLVTIEGNGKPGERFHQNTVFISQSHAKNHRGEIYVYNGIDLDEYPISPTDVASLSSAWQDFLFLAKASWPVKNLNHCKRACRDSRKHLHIAGGRAWSLSPYLHSYGMIGQAKKILLLQRCDALLFPVRWPEPFGIAVIEAFAMGRPVIGSPYGSLPELITETSGRVCENYEEFFETIRSERPKHFKARDIRQEVEDRFSIQGMSQHYLELYEKVRQGKFLNASAPVAQFTNDPQSLLPF